MSRLPSTALVFTTALGMSLTGCSPVANVASAEEASDGSTLETLVTTVEGLRGDVQELTSRITDLESAVASGGGGGDGGNAEAEAAALVTELNTAMEAFDMTEAANIARQLQTDYASTQAYAPLARRTIPELQAIGRPVPQSALDQNVEQWFVDGDIDFDDGVTLVVFWEIWCPHCRREMPELVELYDEYESQGLDIVGLTRLSRDKTPAEVQEFIDENELDYPVAHEGGPLATMFNVSGIPAAAVVKDGEIIWRGHPNRLNASAWAQWLN